MFFVDAVLATRRRFAFVGVIPYIKRAFMRSGVWKYPLHRLLHEGKVGVREVLKVGGNGRSGAGCGCGEVKVNFRDVP